MDREEAERLAGTFANLLREIGESDLADQDRYTLEDPETGRRREDPHKRLMLMISALELRMALEDRSTYQRALREMAFATGDHLERVEILTFTDDVGESPPIILSELPDLTALRDRLEALARRIAEDDRRPSAPK